MGVLALIWYLNSGSEEVKRHDAGERRGLDYAETLGP